MQVDTSGAAVHLLTVSHVPSLCWLMSNPWNPGNCFISAARSAHVAWKLSSLSSGTRNLQHKPQNYITDDGQPC